MSKLMELVEEVVWNAAEEGTIQNALLSEIRAKVQELEREAARYRWLRDESVGQYTHPIVVSQHRAEIGMQYVGPVYGAHLDKAIDAAMEADK